MIYVHSTEERVAKSLFLLFCAMFPLINQASDTAQKVEVRQTKYITAGHAKVAIIGAGMVGSTAAYALMLKNVAAELILVDIVERVQGEVFDLSDVLSFCYASKVRRGSLKDAAKADIIVITAGAPHKPGQTRLDLINVNKTIITSIMREMGPINPYAVILLVSNPVDVMTFLVQQLVDIPKHQVFGSGTFLDTQRLCDCLSHKLGIAQQSIQAFILGEHGDSQFPVWSRAHIAGIPLTDFPDITIEELERIAQETRAKAYEIIKLKGATYYGIGACVAEICESVIFNQKRIMPLSCFVEDLGVCLSVPVVVGENGIEQILNIPLNEREQQSLKKSADTLRAVIDQL